MNGQDPFVHPSNVAEVQSIISNLAAGQKVRVRGSVHSVAHAIYPDGDAPIPNKANYETPPPGNAITLLLDNLTGLIPIDATKGVYEAGAGLWLWYDPNDPSRKSTRTNGLLPRLAAMGWTLPDVGGITHQTVGGFVSTGSSGGSLQWAASEAVVQVTIVDGTGALHDLLRGTPEFDAALVSLGLFGVIVAVQFQCVPLFWIKGQESIATLEDAPLDLLGPGSPSRPSLDGFLKSTEYARLEWWPQPGAQRLVTWQATSLPEGEYERSPYKEFGEQPAIAETAIDLIFAIIGNLDDLDNAESSFEGRMKNIDKSLKYLLGKSKLPWLQELLGLVLEFGGDLTAKALIEILKGFKGLFEKDLPALFADALGVFVPYDGASGPQVFRDTAWQGLPMDNAADDILLPVEFTEMWMPLSYAKQAVNLLNDWWSLDSKDPNGPKDTKEALARTGTFAWELYATRSSSAWLSPAYSTGKDEWADGAFRIDPYWFEGNAGDPCDVFYLQFWKLVRDAGIPFRLHWGKFQPKIGVGDPEGWVNFFAGQYPKWNDFLSQRKKYDPDNRFLTSYWRERFGIVT